MRVFKVSNGVKSVININFTAPRNFNFLFLIKLDSSCTDKY